MDLQQNSKFSRMDFKAQTYIQIEVSENFAPILIPGDMGPGSPFGNTQEGDFMPQHVFIIEV